MEVLISDAICAINVNSILHMFGLVWNSNGKWPSDRPLEIICYKPNATKPDLRVFGLNGHLVSQRQFEDRTSLD